MLLEFIGSPGCGTSNHRVIVLKQVRCHLNPGLCDGERIENPSSPGNRVRTRPVSHHSAEAVEDRRLGAHERPACLGEYDLQLSISAELLPDLREPEKSVSATVLSAEIPANTIHLRDTSTLRPRYLPIRVFSGRHVWSLSNSTSVPGGSRDYLPPIYRFRPHPDATSGHLRMWSTE